MCSLAYRANILARRRYVLFFSIQCNLIKLASLEFLFQFLHGGEVYEWESLFGLAQLYLFPGVGSFLKTCLLLVSACALLRLVNMAPLVPVGTQSVGTAWPVPFWPLLPFFLSFCQIRCLQGGVVVSLAGLDVCTNCETTWERIGARRYIIVLLHGN